MAELGLACTLQAADVDESVLPGEQPAALAERLARLKAQAVAHRVGVPDGPTVVVAADTVVALQDEILGKPDSAEDARRMLRALRGRRHQVYTAICVWDVASSASDVCVNTTQVDMRSYGDAELERYVDSGDPLDKAGAYAIQHAVFAPVQALDGCFASVMGLPLADLCRLLAEYGVAMQCAVADVCERQADIVCCQR